MRTSLIFVDEGADMLLLEPAGRLRSEGDSRLLVELFTLLKRSGADQIVTYVAADIARILR